MCQLRLPTSLDPLVSFDAVMGWAIGILGSMTFRFLPSATNMPHRKSVSYLFDQISDLFEQLVELLVDVICKMIGAPDGGAIAKAVVRW